MHIGGLDLPRTTKHTPLKVNCDVSVRDDGVTGAAWVFQDHNGRLIDVQGCHLGKGMSSVQAEIDAVKRGLDILNGYHQVNHVIVYTDCHPVIDRVDTSNLVAGNFENVRVEWIPREENRIADFGADLYFNEHKKVTPNQTPYGVSD